MDSKEMEQKCLTKLANISSRRFKHQALTPGENRCIHAWQPCSIFRSGNNVFCRGAVATIN